MHIDATNIIVDEHSEKKVKQKGTEVPGTLENEHLLDITHLECPMTFVRAKLFLEGLEPGDLAQIRLNAGEALENLPLAVRQEGHEVLSLIPAPSYPGTHLLRVKVAGESV